MLGYNKRQSRAGTVKCSCNRLLAVAETYARVIIARGVTFSTEFVCNIEMALHKTTSDPHFWFTLLKSQTARRSSGCMQKLCH